MANKFGDSDYVTTDTSVDQASESNPRFIFSTVSESQVFKQLKKLDVNKATGLDNISSRLLKAGAGPLSAPLSHIFNLSLKTGLVPSTWKISRVTPLYKDGSRASIGNYRPISVIPVVMKLLERIVHDQFHEYLTHNNMFSIEQSGFRPKHSTLTTLLEVSDYILKNMDAGHLVGAVFLDLKKAFDTVCHPILLNKLKSFGMKGLEFDWFNSYLSHRKQITKVGTATSDMTSVNFGVPQGSILGPLLFTLYINSLPSVACHCKINLYADDTAVFYAGDSVDDVSEKLTADMGKIAMWMEESRLTLNTSKTKAMLFGSHFKLSNASPLNVFIRDTPLEAVPSFKYLGLNFDQHLSWNLHVDHVTKSVSKYIGLFYRIRKYLSQESLKILHNSLLLPRIDYCDIVWGNCGEGLRGRIERLQLRSARAILRVPVRTSSEYLRKKMGWDTLEQRRNYHLNISVFKCLTGLAPPTLCNFFTLVKDSHTKNTRSSRLGHIRPIKPALEYGKRTFTYRGALAWNQLNSAIKHPMPANTSAFRSKYQSVQ